MYDAFTTANSIGCETESILYHIYTHGEKRGVDCKQCVLFVLHQRGTTQELNKQHDYSRVAREHALHSSLTALPLNSRISRSYMNAHFFLSTSILLVYKLLKLF